jgi:hypothetical protein
MTNTLATHRLNSDNDQCSLTDTESLTLCEEFASVTNTDTGLALMMLQKNGWNLEHAVSAYFDLSVKKIDDQCRVSSVLFFEYQVK